MKTSISKTKVFGTYSISLTNSTNNEITYLDGNLDSKTLLYRDDESSISARYNDIYKLCGLDYEISKAESIKERKENINLQGKLSFIRCSVKNLIHCENVRIIRERSK